MQQEHHTPHTFAAIYAAEFTYLWNTLRRLGCPARDLEDLVHDVFLVVHRRMGDFDPNRPIRPWLFGIAYRVLSDHKRKAHHRREIREPDTDTIDTSPGVDEQVHQHQVQQRSQALVQAALLELDEKKRAVFILHEIDGVAVPLVAESLDIPLNTAYSRLRLARQDFTKTIRRLQAKEVTHA